MTLLAPAVGGGVITGEARLHGREIDAIRIADRCSLVEECRRRRPTA